MPMAADKSFSPTTVVANGYKMVVAEKKTKLLYKYTIVTALSSTDFLLEGVWRLNRFLK